MFFETERQTEKEREGSGGWGGICFIIYFFQLPASKGWFHDLHHLQGFSEYFSPILFFPVFL